MPMWRSGPQRISPDTCNPSEFKVLWVGTLFSIFWVECLKEAQSSRKGEEAMIFRDVFQEMDRLRREVDALFTGVPYSAGVPRWRGHFLPLSGAQATPPINIWDEGEVFKVEALAPGVDPDTISVTANRDGLTLSGERRAPQGIRTEQFHRSERTVGRFTRTFSLSVPIDAHRVSAEYKNGILTVLAPKAEEAKPRAISVAVSN
jgi:HSP20 family protein